MIDPNNPTSRRLRVEPEDDNSSDGGYDGLSDANEWARAARATAAAEAAVNEELDRVAIVRRAINARTAAERRNSRADEANERNEAAARATAAAEAATSEVWARAFAERNASIAEESTGGDVVVHNRAAPEAVSALAADEWARAFASNGGEWARQRRPVVSASSLHAAPTPPPRRFPPAIETSIPPRRPAAVAPAPDDNDNLAAADVVVAVQGVAIERINDGSNNYRWVICGERWRGSWQHRDALAAWLDGWSSSGRARLRARQLRRYRRRFETARATLAVMCATPPDNSAEVNESGACSAGMLFNYRLRTTGVRL